LNNSGSRALSRQSSSNVSRETISVANVLLDKNEFK